MVYALYTVYKHNDLCVIYINMLIYNSFNTSQNAYSATFDTIAAPPHTKFVSIGENYYNLLDSIQKKLFSVYILVSKTHARRGLDRLSKKPDLT